MPSSYPHHPAYIPVIKWQQYERYALRHLPAEVQDRVTPCIEIRTSKQHQNLVDNYHSVRASHTTLVDYSDPDGRLSGVRLAEFRDFLKIAKTNNYSVVPTLSPNDLNSLSFQDLNLLASFGEVAIREKISDFSLSSGQDSRLRAAIGKIKSVDNCSARVLIDKSQAPEAWTRANCTQLANAIDQIAAAEIKSIHLLSGAYPESLTTVKTGMAEFKRNDWALWKDVNNICTSNVGFGDYGILNPYWTEETLELRGQRLAIRYTRDQDWLILRADGKTRDHSIAISQILVNVYSSDFKGASYSYGDKLLEERADPMVPDKDKKCGHYHITEGWNHHISFVVKDQY
jgi:T4 beta protein|tara:strand:+ start:161 stop:1192 length:1032 start_codon:yes stop_codon:yes gene_type:complete